MNCVISGDNCVVFIKYCVVLKENCVSLEFIAPHLKGIAYFSKSGIISLFTLLPTLQIKEDQSYKRERQKKNRQVPHTNIHLKQIFM